MEEGMDVRSWDEGGYRRSILEERELRGRTVFRTAFAPSAADRHPDILVAASSDGSVAPYHIPSCIPNPNISINDGDGGKNRSLVGDFVVAEPVCLLRGHDGPAYDVKFYGVEDETRLLLSCGDDGHIRGWRWKDVVNSVKLVNARDCPLEPVIDLVNPQEKGPWGALSPIPENNAIASGSKCGSIFSAAGDSCAYCWDVETSKCKMVFSGHSSYLHCIAVRQESNQIITGSEDGTVRTWDCRSGKCVKTIIPESGLKAKEALSWVGCIALDTSESWLACGGSKSLTVCSLPTYEPISRLDNRFPTQDVLFDGNQVLAVGQTHLLTRLNINGKILSQIRCAPPSAFSISLHSSGVMAVAGYGGLVDVVSQFENPDLDFKSQEMMWHQHLYAAEIAAMFCDLGIRL